MHKIEVVVQADCLRGVSEALRKAKIGSYRASDITVFEPAKPDDGSYRGASYALGRERVKLELVVAENEIEPAVEAIRGGIEAFGRSDSELVVMPIDGFVRRTSA